jgi:hypothetical protein
MRLMCVFLAIATLAACDSDRTTRPVATTKATLVTVQTTPKTSTTVRASTTTMATNDGDPGESIGVTDKVTIVITDPEDG